jgi:hypothetical protein
VLDALVQTLLGIDQVLITPHVPLDLFASDELARAAGQECEDADRLRAKVDEHSGLSQLSTFGIEFENPEANGRPTRHVPPHGALLRWILAPG